MAAAEQFISQMPRSDQSATSALSFILPTKNIGSCYPSSARVSTAEKRPSTSLILGSWTLTWGDCSKPALTLRRP